MPIKRWDFIQSSGYLALGSSLLPAAAPQAVFAGGYQSRFDIDKALIKFLGD